MDGNKTEVLSQVSTGNARESYPAKAGYYMDSEEQPSIIRPTYGYGHDCKATTSSATDAQTDEPESSELIKKLTPLIVETVRDVNLNIRSAVTKLLPPFTSTDKALLSDSSSGRRDKRKKPRKVSESCENITHSEVDDDADWKGASDSTKRCDNCKQGICRGCENLSSSEVEVLEMKGERILKFECPKCVRFNTHTLLQSTIEDKIKIIESKDEIIALLRLNIQKLENTVTQPSFSEVVQGQSHKALTKTGNIPSMIIKPKKNQSTDKTKQDLRININPSELKVGIRGARGTKNCGILIKCEKADDLEILRKDMTEKLKEYEIQINSLKKPRFKITGYKRQSEEVLDMKLIEKHIREQNQFIDKEDEFQ
ncbi:hypothetical protein WA026_022240 [Henosepilachna vigintioctopunctata]|uniref:Uncharacterized protein n=1 Tax=Henosepilachna vigintioctopunctata TaxID=420089 RepID=A0AAW1UG62_9CUCU